jgi:hypothetical protein
MPESSLKGEFMPIFKGINGPNQLSGSEEKTQYLYHLKLYFVNLSSSFHSYSRSHPVPDAGQADTAAWMKRSL